MWSDLIWPNVIWSNLILSNLNIPLALEAQFLFSRSFSVSLSFCLVCFCLYCFHQLNASTCAIPTLGLHSRKVDSHCCLIVAQRWDTVMTVKTDRDDIRLLKSSAVVIIIIAATMLNHTKRWHGVTTAVELNSWSVML